MSVQPDDPANEAAEAMVARSGVTDTDHRLPHGLRALAVVARRLGRHPSGPFAFHGVDLERPPPVSWPGDPEPPGTTHPRRRAELAHGRHAARVVLARLGVEPAGIPVGPDREPVFPGGVLGSIAHGAGVVVAAAARRSARLSGVGIDVESVGGVDEELSGTVLGVAERRRLAGVPEPVRPLFATVAFCVKEAVFKAQFPLTRRWLEFADVEVAPHADGAGPDGDEGFADVTVAGSAGDVHQVAWAHVGGVVVAVALLTGPPA